MDISITELSSSPYQTTICYLNDNFIIPELFGKEINQGKDNYMTAGFQIQIVREQPENRWFFDICHNILTNKESNYRTDLLTMRFSIEKNSFAGHIRLGSGIISSGNFGGRVIQNRYHKLIGMKSVELSYAEKNRFGMLALIKYNPTILSSKHIRLKGYLAGSYMTIKCPGNVKAGIELDLAARMSGKAPVYHFQAHTGYVNFFYNKGRYLSPLFDRGFTWGILASGGLTEKYNVSVWITNNQYGTKQPHYGISYTFGWNGRTITDLSDTAFP